jgi:hypothetical protein
MDKQQQQYIEEWLKEQAKLKSRKRRKKNVPDEGGVTINSLMDVVTIILIFLLMNFSTDPMKVTPHDKLKLPLSTTQLSPTDRTITLTIEADQILVGDKSVVNIKGGQVDDNSMEKGSLSIPQLKTYLDLIVAERTAEDAQNGLAFKDIITIIAHGETEYYLINQVIYTAGTASFTKFKFAVIKEGQLQQAI